MDLNHPLWNRRVADETNLLTVLEFTLGQHMTQFDLEAAGAKCECCDSMEGKNELEEDAMQS